MLAATLMFAGCGDAGATSAVLSGPAAQTRTDKAAESYESLLYASGNSKVVILTYPGGKKVGSITGVVPAGICTDATNGNVWIVTEVSKGFYAYEFSHGGTTPIEKLRIPNTILALECAVDSSTHNLAVTNWEPGGDRPYIDVWSGGGTSGWNAYPTPFSPEDVVYDNEGDLFAAGETERSSFQLAELRQGSSIFTNIQLDRRAVWPGGLAWDGEHVAVGSSDSGGVQKFERIYRVRIQGTRGRVVSTHEFRQLPKRSIFWLQGDTIIAAPEMGKGDAFWRYPQGGRPYKIGIGSFNAYYVAVSVAPSDSQTRK